MVLERQEILDKIVWRLEHIMSERGQKLRVVSNFFQKSSKHSAALVKSTDSVNYPTYIHVIKASATKQLSRRPVYNGKHFTTFLCEQENAALNTLGGIYNYRE